MKGDGAVFDPMDWAAQTERANASRKGAPPTSGNSPDWAKTTPDKGSASADENHLCYFPKEKLVFVGKRKPTLTNPPTTPGSGAKAKTPSKGKAPPGRHRSKEAPEARPGKQGAPKDLASKESPFKVRKGSAHCISKETERV